MVPAISSHWSLEMIRGGAMAMPSLLARTIRPRSRVASCSLPPTFSAGSNFVLGRLVGDELDDEHQTLAADVADVRVIVQPAVQRAEQVVAHRAGVLGQVLVLDDLDVAEADRAGDRVTASR